MAPWFLQPDLESSKPHLSVWATLRVGSPIEPQSSSFRYGAEGASGTREGQLGNSMSGTALAGRGRKRVGSATPPVERPFPLPEAAAGSFLEVVLRWSAPISLFLKTPRARSPLYRSSSRTGLYRIVHLPSLLQSRLPSQTLPVKITKDSYNQNSLPNQSLSSIRSARPLFPS